MTATNHMLAGAVMAAGLHHPLLVFPAAFFSHFLLDALPHFGVHEHDTAVRNRHPLFRYILAIDIMMALAMLAVVPFALGKGVSWVVVALGMLFAWIPDASQIRHFMHQLRGREHKLSRFSRFHFRIQWFERPLGIIVELAWFAAMVAFLGHLAT